MQPLPIALSFWNPKESVRRTPYWLMQHVNLDDESTHAKRCHCLEAWKRFVELCDWFELDLKTRLRIVGGAGRRSYFRWCAKARNGVPFQIPSRTYLLSHALDVLETVRERLPSAAEAQRFLRSPLERKPFTKQTPLSLLMLGKSQTTWPLYVQVVSRLDEMGPAASGSEP